MGLSVTLSNALSGMRTTQDGLSVLSRNVANSGSAGYHRQSVVIKDMNGGSGSYASFVGVKRAFVDSLERAHVREISATGYADVRDTFLRRLEVAFGKPGDANSLDTLMQGFSKSVEALAVSPEDYATRAGTVSAAQNLAQQLNTLSTTIQDLRQETENQISAEVDTLNQSLQSLQQINQRLSDYSLDEGSRLSVLDQRDRLVGRISEIVDARATYRSDGTVALMTKAGLGLLDQGATTFQFNPAGSISAQSVYDIKDADNGVGVLTAYTPSGLKLDVIDQRIVQSGRIAALVEMRDNTLVQAQAQLDTIAGALSQALSTNVTDGTEVTVVSDDGFDVDVSALQSGNEIVLNYTESGTEKTVRVVSVNDASVLPIDYTTQNGERVVGIDFSSGDAAAAADLDTLLGAGVNVSSPSAGTIRILNDSGATTTINAAEARTTSQGPQDQGRGLNLFTDLGNASFTNSLDGAPQMRGYAARISVNPDILTNNELLVQHQAGNTLGDPARVNYFLERLEDVDFRSDQRKLPDLGTYSLSGNVSSIVRQVINYQGDQIAAGAAALDTQNIALEAVEMRMEDEYGVDIDEEMARLIELQNAYAASARVVSIAQELIDSLMQI